MTTRMRRVDELTIGVAIAASGFEKVTEFGYWLLQFVGLVSSEEHQLVIHDSVADCMPFGYGDRSAALHAPVGDS